MIQEEHIIITMCGMDYVNHVIPMRDENIRENNERKREDCL
mgnify:FL=1